MNPRPFSILIVSPDRLTLRRLSKFLEVFGYVVKQARDASQALAAAENSPPDFLIVDGTQGNATGLQLAREIRKSVFARRLYALLLVEQPEVSEIAAALEQGFDDFLTAPIVFGELLARLRAGARGIEFERRLTEQEPLDTVTGLATEGALASELERRGQRKKGTIGWLAVLDLDYFRRFAQRWSALETSALLRQVADRVAHKCSPDDFAAALVHDRLAVILVQENEDTAVKWAEQVLAAVAESPFTVADQPVPLTASCGLTPVVSGEKLVALVARCERAVGLSKASGRNCVTTTGDVERDADEWTEFAAAGKLFQTTLARHVMQPCPLLLHLDETVEQAHASLLLTNLPYAPVIDQEGKLAGIVSLDQLAGRMLQSKSRASGAASTNSVRLVRHVMNPEISRFDETTPLAELMEFFTLDGAPLAVIVKNKRPLGLVHCQGLATLNERLTTDCFANQGVKTGASSDLVVPELALAE